MLRLELKESRLAVFELILKSLLKDCFGDFGDEVFEVSDVLSHERYLTIMNCHSCGTPAAKSILQYIAAM
jgi:hypothetical protein